MSMSTTVSCKVAIYCRVATEHQAFYIVELQKKILRSYAERLGNEIVAEVIDVGSGRSIYRPGMQKLLELARNKEIKAVYAVDPSRVARDTRMLVDLIAEFGMYDVKLEFAKQPDISKILDSISSSDMENYFKTKEEINRAK